MTHEPAPCGQEPEHDPAADTTRMFHLSPLEAEVAGILGYHVRWRGDECYARLTTTELRQVNRVLDWGRR